MLFAKNLLSPFHVQCILFVNLKLRAAIFSLYLNFDALAMTHFNGIIFDEDILDAVIWPYEKGEFKL